MYPRYLCETTGQTPASAADTYDSHIYTLICANDAASGNRDSTRPRTRSQSSGSNNTCSGLGAAGQELTT